MNKVLPTDERATSAAEPAVTDEQLMAKIRVGDEAAFATLFDRYSASINGLCVRVLRSPAEAEAVVSDVFWEIWQRPQRFDATRGSCATYLFTLARSRAIDRLRSAAVRIRKTKQAGEQYPVHDFQEPFDDVAAGERKRFVRQALEKLDQDQRDALQLAYFDGLTHSEISLKLDRPLGTIKTHIRRGLQSLRAALKSLGGHDELS